MGKIEKTHSLVGPLLNITLDERLIMMYFHAHDTFIIIVSEILTTLSRSVQTAAVTTHAH